MDKEKNYALRGMGAAAALAAAPAAAMAGISMLSAPGEEAPQVRIAGTRLTDGEEIDLPLLGAHLDRLPVSFSDGGEPLAGNSFSAFPGLSARFGNYGAREIFGRCLSAALSPKAVSAAAGNGVNCIKINADPALTVRNEKYGKLSCDFSRFDEMIASCEKAGLWVLAGAHRYSGVTLKEKEAFRYTALLAEHLAGCKAAAALEVPGDCEVTTGKKAAKLLKAIRKAGFTGTVLFDSGSITPDELLSAGDEFAGVSRRQGFCNMADASQITAEAAGFTGRGITYVVTDIYPYDLNALLPLFAENGIAVFPANIKGGTDSFLAGTVPLLDLKADTYESMGEKIEDSLKDKVFKQNDYIKSALQNQISL